MSSTTTKRAAERETNPAPTPEPEPAPRPEQRTDVRRRMMALRRW